MSTLHCGSPPHTGAGSGLGGSAAGIVFGPMPSRRFGRSLGVNNLHPKVCPYSCAYCQLGRTVRMGTERQAFHGADAVARAVRARLEEARSAGERIDHVTFVPRGEPTLDAGLGRAVHLLRSLGVPVAVVTNGALLGSRDVRAALSEADHVSIKVDAVREEPWRRVNRPHRRLDLGDVLDGMRAFAGSYAGALSTETTLVRGGNDDDDDVGATAAFVASLHPDVAYLSVPAFPTAEEWALPPSAATLKQAADAFRSLHPRVELLTGSAEPAPRSPPDPAPWRARRSADILPG